MRTIAEMMEELCGPLSGIIPDTAGIPSRMWVLTNPQCMYGASAIMYSSCLDRLAGESGGDLYILPSSIHELIAVPAVLEDPDVLLDMVRFINCDRNVIAAEDVLGDSVYLYGRKSGKLSIVSEIDEKIDSISRQKHGAYQIK